MKGGCSILILAICLGVGACQPAGQGGLPVSGEVLFKAKQCYSCHSIGHGDLAGPDLRGLLSRRPEPWVRAYLTDPIKMAQEDPTARALKERYKVQMPKVYLSPEELNQLIAYLKKATR